VANSLQELVEPVIVEPLGVAQTADQAFQLVVTDQLKRDRLFVHEPHEQVARVAEREFDVDADDELNRQPFVDSGNVAHDMRRAPDDSGVMA